MVYQFKMKIIILNLATYTNNMLQTNKPSIKNKTFLTPFPAIEKNPLINTPSL